MQTNHNKNTIAKERGVLVIFILYTIGLTAMSYWMDWHHLIPQVLMTGMVVSLFVHIKQYKTYQFRAVITSCIIWIDIVIYGCATRDMAGIYVTMCCLIALTGIYGISELTYLGPVVFLFLLIYHIRDLTTQYLSVQGVGKISMFLQISSIYLASYAVYYLNRQQEKNSESLIDTIADLEEAQRSKNDFMANMSHEIRTPINTVCGISEIIMNERNLPEQTRREILDIQTAGRHLLSLISDILDFSELETGKMELAEEPYNITSTINDVLNIAISKNSTKKLEIIVDCDSTIPSSLFGDEQKIRRVVSNMVDNAIKFTKEGGVLLSVSARWEEYGINLIVTVSDTGIGMNEDECERLFTGFQQVNTRRDRSEGGIGLGLAISQAIIGKMGGFITVNSAPGRGSKVQFTIPQKVLDQAPIVSLKNPESLRVLAYLNMDKYTYSLIREGYATAVQHIVKGLGFYFIQCKTLAELKRRVEREHFSHIFIAAEEYDEAKSYFDEISLTRTVALVLDREYWETHDIGKNILPVYKPFFVLPIAAVLNDEVLTQNTDGSQHKERQFVAPEAKVLIVDDNPMNLRVMEGLLRPYQIQVITAEDGKDALKKIEAKDFDFVFMDHMMPGMDGVEVLHRIRQKSGQYFKTVPIIALTANAMGGAREMFLSEGFADFVAKPVETSVLDRALCRHIPESKQLPISEAPEIMPSVTMPETAQSEKTPETAQPAKMPETAQPAKAPEAASGGGGAPEISMEGINVAVGLGFCGGNIDDYVDVVKIYHKTGQTKLGEAKKAYEEKDWHTYTIHAHSIKSISAGIGAMALSDMAKELEAASREQREDYITAHNDEMLAEYERVLTVISQNRVIFPEDLTASQTLPEIAKEQFLTELTSLQEELETFEADGVRARLEQLSSYQFEGEPLGRLLGGIKEKVDGFDFMGAGDDVSAMIEKMR